MRVSLRSGKSGRDCTERESGLSPLQKARRKVLIVLIAYPSHEVTKPVPHPVAVELAEKRSVVKADVASLSFIHVMLKILLCSFAPSIRRMVQLQNELVRPEWTHVARPSRAGWHIHQRESQGSCQVRTRRGLFLSQTTKRPISQTTKQHCAEVCGQGEGDGVC